MKKQHSYLFLFNIALLLGCSPDATERFEKYPGSHPQAQAEMMMTYVDPVTRQIPPGIRHKELAYSSTLPKRSNIALRNGDSYPYIRWQDAGPSNVGGRTRALAFDFSNPNIMLAGGATGGIWKSTDSGESWALKSVLGSPLNVTTLAQDPRPEFADTWYFATGELRGESGWDRGYTARNYGAGIYKSTDNGEFWTALTSTIPGNETTWDGAFDFVHKIIISPTTGTRFIANNGSGIYRTTNDIEFPRVLGATSDHLYNDIAVGTDGRLVAVMSSLRVNWTHNTSGGIYISTNDGMDWQDITPPTFPAQHHRSLVAIAPSNPDIAYVLTYTGNTFANGREDIRFHYINLAGSDFNPGPSIRSVAILPLSFAGLSQTLYLAGTSAGLFATDQFNGFETVWEREASEELGTAIAEMVFARASDGRIAVGTFGRGIIIGDMDVETSVEETLADSEANLELQLSPNPAYTHTILSWELSEVSSVSLKLYNMHGQLLQTYLSNKRFKPGTYRQKLEVAGFTAGLYLLELKVGSRRHAKIINKL